MGIGDIFNPKRIRVQANERLDTFDVDGFSAQTREHLDAWSRAVEAVPRRTGSAFPTGLIIQGFPLQLNPTGASDNKVRVIATLPSVAFDADGRMLIKEAGSSTDLTLPSGNSQIYAYYSEVGTENAVRRRISVTSPYTESGTSQLTRFLGGVAFHVRAGDQTSIVASDVINGVTTALCFLGVANNAAGVITMTGYNATTAPNGAFATNRITSVSVPTTLPALNTNNGSITTMHDLLTAALYMTGQAVWKGSKNFTPAAGNNFGAFTPPTVGIDGLFDSQAEATFTPTTRWRDWQQNVRYLVDHQGFPGGQISVKDEHWLSSPVTINISPSSGYKTVGTAAAMTSLSFGVSFVANNDAWLVHVSDAVPIGAFITSVVVHYLSGSATNTITAALQYVELSSGVTTAAVSRTVTTTTFGTNVSFDVMTTPTSGKGPKLVRSDEKLQIHLQTPAVTLETQIFAIQITYVEVPAGWSSSFINVLDSEVFGQLISFQSPFAEINQRNLKFDTVNSSFVGSMALSSVPEVFINSSLAHAIECMIRTGTVISGANSPGVFIGVTSSDPFWGLTHIAGEANWKLVLSNDDLGHLSLDTGIAFASNTTYRIKIEFQGSSLNSSGFARARVWINGALVGTLTESLAVPDAVGQVLLSFSTTAAVGPYSMSIGRLHRAWNHLVTGDNV